jgi:UDP-N-acetyl-D-galactosamine dehydrogenase
VGGHCIGVDPYYLTSKAEEVGIHPQVILAGRRINDGMGAFVAAKTAKLLSRAGRSVSDARIAVLGLAFKADVPDIRNSRVPDVVRELEDYGAEVLVHDPLVAREEARERYGLELAAAHELSGLDGVVLAVAHAGLPELALELVAPDAGGAPRPCVLVDVMAALERARVPKGVVHWRL